MSARGLSPVELGAGIGQHGWAQVDAETASISVAEELEHAAGAGAQVEEEVEGSGPQHLRKDGFNMGFGHVQGADPIPFSRMRLEVGLGRRLALYPQGLGAA